MFSSIYFPNFGGPRELEYRQHILTQHLEAIMAEKPNTVIFLVADHGSSQHAKCDQRKPFLGVLVPKKEEEFIKVRCKRIFFRT